MSMHQPPAFTSLALNNSHLDSLFKQEDIAAAAASMASPQWPQQQAGTSNLLAGFNMLQPSSSFGASAAMPAPPLSMAGYAPHSAAGLGAPQRSLTLPPIMSPFEGQANTLLKGAGSAQFLVPPSPTGAGLAGYNANSPGSSGGQPPPQYFGLGSTLANNSSGGAAAGASGSGLQPISTRHTPAMDVGAGSGPDSPVAEAPQVFRSQYRGVSYDKKKRKWRVQIKVAALGKSGVSVGYFDTEDSAARAYDRAAIGLLGRQNCRAILNFPIEEYDNDSVPELVGKTREEVKATLKSERAKLPRRRLTNRRRTSRYLGVGSSNRKNQWQARILYHGKVTHLGYYRTEEEAARVYDKVSISLHGENAQTNFPIDQYSGEVVALQAKLSGLTREELQRALGVKPMDKSSKFRGVSKKKGKWEAKVMVNRKWAYRELCDTEAEAARAYDAAVWRLKPKEAKSYVNFKDSCPPDVAEMLRKAEKEDRGLALHPTGLPLTAKPLIDAGLLFDEDGVSIKTAMNQKVFSASDLASLVGPAGSSDLGGGTSPSGSGDQAGSGQEGAGAAPGGMVRGGGGSHNALATLGDTAAGPSRRVGMRSVQSVPHLQSYGGHDQPPSPMYMQPQQRQFSGGAVPPVTTGAAGRGEHHVSFDLPPMGAQAPAVKQEPVTWGRSASLGYPGSGITPAQTGRMGTRSQSCGSLAVMAGSGSPPLAPLTMSSHEATMQNIFGGGDTSLLMPISGADTKPLLVRVGSESHLITSNPTGRGMSRIQSEGTLSSMVPMSPSGKPLFSPHAGQLGAGHHMLGHGGMPRALSVAHLDSIDEMNATSTYPAGGMLGLSGELELGELGFKGQQGMFSPTTSAPPRPGSPISNMLASGPSAWQTTKQPLPQAPGMLFGMPGTTTAMLQPGSSGAGMLQPTMPGMAVPMTSMGMPAGTYQQQLQQQQQQAVQAHQLQAQRQMLAQQQAALEQQQAALQQQQQQLYQGMGYAGFAMPTSQPMLAQHMDRTGSNSAGLGVKWEEPLNVPGSPLGNVQIGGEELDMTMAFLQDPQPDEPALRQPSLSVSSGLAAFENAMMAMTQDASSIPMDEGA